QLVSLRELAGGDELVESAVSAIPEEAAAKGIPTLPQLRDRFRTVHGECRRVSLVPEQAGSGLGGQIWGSILAKVTMAPSGMVEGDSAECVLARAKHLVEVGELASAVGELDKLKGLPAETIRDWLSDAKTRLLADQARLTAMTVIRCHASLLSASRSKPADMASTA
ncbi:unnamed protein product, partial [Choristocarpus tenellus]